MSEGRKILDMGVRRPISAAALEPIFKGAGTDLYSAMPTEGGVVKLSESWPFTPENRALAKKLFEPRADGMIVIDVQPEFSHADLPLCFDGQGRVVA